MINNELEKIIDIDFLANKGIIRLDDKDIQKLREDSDFIDGAAIDGKLDELGELAGKAVTLIKNAHPNNKISILILKLRIAIGSELIMCQLNPINDLFCDLGNDTLVMWGIEVNAPLSDECRVCVLCGFKKS